MSGVPRVGVVVLDHGRAADTKRAVASALDPSLDPRVLVVENGSSRAESSRDRLCLPENLGFGGGMNAGITHLRREGCDRFLLLNNDAALEPGCLRLLAEALADPAYAAVGPVILDQVSGRVESRGLCVDLGWGRVRLEGHGRLPDNRDGLREVNALSGAVIMLSLTAIERVGLLDADYFYGFEDVDWCLRARAAGFLLGLVERARARHAGGASLGRDSPERLYYGMRNHLRCVEIHRPLTGWARGLRRAVIVGLNLAHALRRPAVRRRAALLAVREGFRDGRRGRVGPRRPAIGSPA